MFERENPGFDAFVGNPPFAGKNTISEGQPRAVISTGSRRSTTESHGNADLVAHFFRRAFNLLRPSGTFGLIATNTIAQGDTRTTGLRWICTHGGTIYAATQRDINGRDRRPSSSAWFMLHKGARSLVPFDLDGRSRSERITAYLFHAGGHDDPQTRGQRGKSFHRQHTFSAWASRSTTPTRRAWPTRLPMMHELIAKDPRNAERIFPYIGGEEVNDQSDPCAPSLRHQLRRDERGGGTAVAGPDGIVEERSSRTRCSAEPDGAPVSNWWQYRRAREPSCTMPSGAWSGCWSVSLISQASGVYLPTQRDGVFINKLIVFALDELSLRLLSSSPASTKSGPASSARSHEGRPALHAIRLLRDLPVPRELRDEPDPRSSRPSLLRLPRRPDGPATTRA